MLRILAALSIVCIAGQGVTNAPDASLTPKLRPDGLKTSNAIGPICGQDTIIGRPIPPIPGKIEGCGLANGVEVLSVSGVILSVPAKMDCQTAQTLASWTKQSVIPRVDRTGGGIKSLTVVGHYSCRTRNNRPGAKVSEHGKGRAIDIAGFRLHDGSTISVLNDWGKGKRGRILRNLHKDACGPFGTVLGPESDAAHADHFHLDTARYRAGSYCR
ncbi:MAG: extensin-like domain-containing protein [Planktomarina sp.]